MTSNKIISGNYTARKTPKVFNIDNPVQAAFGGAARGREWCSANHNPVGVELQENRSSGSYSTRFLTPLRCVRNDNSTKGNEVAAATHGQKYLTGSPVAAIIAIRNSRHSEGAKRLRKLVPYHWFASYEGERYPIFPLAVALGYCLDRYALSERGFLFKSQSQTKKTRNFNINRYTL